MNIQICSGSHAQTTDIDLPAATPSVLIAPFFTSADGAHVFGCITPFSSQIVGHKRRHGKKKNCRIVDDMTEEFNWKNSFLGAAEFSDIRPCYVFFRFRPEYKQYLTDKKFLLLFFCSGQHQKNEVNGKEPSETECEATCRSLCFK